MRTRDSVDGASSPEYGQWIVLDKGTLHNMDVKNPFSPSLAREGEKSNWTLRGDGSESHMMWTGLFAYIRRIFNAKYVT